MKTQRASKGFVVDRKRLSMQVSPLAQSYKQVKRSGHSPYQILCMGEDPEMSRNANTQGTREAVNYFQTSTQRITDYYVSKINHKNELHFKVRRSNQDYKKAEKVNDRLRLGALNHHQEAARTENSRRDFEPSSGGSRAGLSAGQQNYVKSANGGAVSAYIGTRDPQSKTGQNFFNRRYMFSQLSPSSTQEQLPNTAQNLNVQSDRDEATFYTSHSFMRPEEPFGHPKQMDQSALSIKKPNLDCLLNNDYTTAFSWRFSSGPATASQMQKRNLAVQTQPYHQQRRLNLVE